MAVDLKEVRTSRHLTQEQLANACNVGRSTIANIEIGNIKPSIELAKRLTKELELAEWADFFD